MSMSTPTPFTPQEIAQAQRYAAGAPAVAYDPAFEADPRVQALVKELIGRVADKWTLLILEVLTERVELRFSRLGELVTGISQKMLTQTLRQMERDGLLTRKVHAVVPPRVDYRLTGLGLGLGAAFCGVWVWAAENLGQVERSRRQFDRRAAKRK